MDLVVVDAKKVSLLLNKPYRNFLEYTGEDNPFSKVVLSDPMLDAWNMVDVDGDGDLDLVYFPMGRPDLSRPGPNLASGPRYFEQMADGNLEERSGTANPLQEVPTSLRSPDEHRPNVSQFGMNHFVADVDGDGDVDVVHGHAKGVGLCRAAEWQVCHLEGHGQSISLGYLALQPGFNGGAENKANTCISWGENVLHVRGHKSYKLLVGVACRVSNELQI